jgi:hypothetical protein
VNLIWVILSPHEGYSFHHHEIARFWDKDGSNLKIFFHQDFVVKTAVDKQLILQQADLFEAVFSVKADSGFLCGVDREPHFDNIFLSLDQRGFHQHPADTPAAVVFPDINAEDLGEVFGFNPVVEDQYDYADRHACGNGEKGVFHTFFPFIF